MLSVTSRHHAVRRRSRAAGLILGLASLTLVVPGVAAAPAVRAVAPAVSATSDATTPTLEGIDVSHWQGTIDWKKVAAAGKRFAILKATESTNYVDPKYATNHAAAKANAIWTGAYHFARPDASANDARLEADWFAGHVNLSGGDLVPTLDLEIAGGLGVSALQAWVKTFLDQVTARTGVRPMIYTSPSFWKTYMGDSRALADAGYKILWVAHWRVASPAVPASNWGGRGWTFWQYDDCATVPGIAGCVDVDRYRGTDFSPVAYSTFKISASVDGAKQGGASDATVAISRTNFDADVALNVGGLPAGATASFDVNPVADDAAALTVATNPDPTATPVGTYPLTITGVAGGITRTTKVNLVVSDGVPPTLTAPVASLAAGMKLGATNVPVRVRGTASDPSGVAATTVQRTSDGTSWSTAAAGSSAAIAANTYVSTTASTRLRARATDTKGNTSDWRAGSLIKAAIYQQTSTAVAWTGTWHTARWSGASGGSVRYATARGASATFRFTGSSVAWVGTLGTRGGGAWVYVDGRFAKSVSLYASSGHSRAVVFAQNWSTVGTHTVKIVAAGTPGHPRVIIDAFARLTIS